MVGVRCDTVLSFACVIPLGQVEMVKSSGGLHIHDLPRQDRGFIPVQGCGEAPPHRPSVTKSLRCGIVVANFLRTTIDTLAQKRVFGNGAEVHEPRPQVLYRWTDVLNWLEHNTIHRTDDPR
jgi:hypothetical protein